MKAIFNARRLQFYFVGVPPHSKLGCSGNTIACTAVSPCSAPYHDTRSIFCHVWHGSRAMVDPFFHRHLSNLVDELEDAEPRGRRVLKKIADKAVVKDDKFHRALKKVFRTYGTWK